MPKLLRNAAVAIPEFVYHFAEVPAADPALLGGKGAGLARMVESGLPVPPGFIISTDAFRAYHRGGRHVPDQLMVEVWAALERLEVETGKRFGAAGGVPLLVSVRSGAKISMPGMMDTILNLGLDATGIGELAAASGDVDFAIDTYLRFWHMYADIVLGLDATVVDQAQPAIEAAREGDFDALQRAVVAALEHEGVSAAWRPRDQLAHAIAAVFNSWESRRAITYRRHHGIPDDLGTAVVVQSMVFGNLGHPSGSGVAFTRNPITGENLLYGEYLEGGQGEEVVAGTRTPARLDELRSRSPELVRTLDDLGHRLEEVYSDALDIEFTVERGTVYLLQVRVAKRTAAAAIRIATDMLECRSIPAADAVLRVSAEQVRHLMRPEFSAAARAAAEVEGAKLGRGIGASPGHVSGVAVLDADRAVSLAAAGKDVILVRPTTSPQDLHGMLAARGIVTALGGATSHAAVVARALDKPCVVGCSTIQVDLERRLVRVADRSFPEGTPISIDGGQGDVYAGTIPMESGDGVLTHLRGLLETADELSASRIWGAVSGPRQATSMLHQGVAGLGVVDLAELLVALGNTAAVQSVVEAVDRRDSLATPLENLSRAVSEAVELVVEVAAGRPLDLRLLDFSSSRSRALLGLDPLMAANPLLLPLGVPEVVLAQLRGASRGLVTALLSRVAGAGEVKAFGRLAEDAGGISYGVLVQTPRAALCGQELLELNVPVWIDLPELQRTAACYPEEIVTQEVMRRYAAEHDLPRHAAGPIDPALAGVIGNLCSVAASRATPRLGVDLGAAVDEETVASLYELGLRTYACSYDQVQPLRLLVGQAGARQSAGG